MGGLQEKNSPNVPNKLGEDGLLSLTEKIAGNFWTTVTWAVCDGDVPIMLAWCGKQLRGGETERRGDGVGPWQRSTVEARDWVPQQRSAVGHSKWRDGLARRMIG